MSDGTVERTRESESDTAATPDVDLPDGDTTGATEIGVTESQETEEADGSYFSVGALVVAVVAIGAGMTLGSLVPLVPFTSFVGIPAGALLHGLLDSERRYAETAVAGGLLAGLSTVASLLPQIIGGLDGTRLFAVAAGVGLVLALVGHYFGRDLRDGLTRDI